MLLSIEAAIQLSRLRRLAGQVVGWTTGAFDLFHRGHLRYLEQCRASCDILIVGVDNDAFVRTRKGPSRPRQTVEQRAATLVSSGLTDALFIKDTEAWLLIEAFLPNLYFVPDNIPADSPKFAVAADLGIHVEVLPYTRGISTSELLKELDRNS